MEEVWKDVRGFEDTHLVSNTGKVIVKACQVSRTRVYSGKEVTHKYTRSQKILRPTVSSDGYLNIYFKGSCHSVHRWVANTFIPNPDNKPQVNHIDGDKTNNSIYNLEWCTPSENVAHSYKLGLASNKGERHPQSILKECHIPVIRAMSNQGMSSREIAPLFNVGDSTIRKVLTRKLWGHIE